MHVKKISFVILVACTLLSCLSPKNKDCLSEEILIEKSIDAINKRDPKEYILLFDSKKLLDYLNATPAKDKEMNEIIEEFENDKNSLIDLHTISYNILIRTIERIHKIENYHFKLIDFDLIKRKNEYGFIIEKYKTYLKDNNDNKWNLDIYLLRDGTCYYLVESIEANYLSKGW